MALTKQKKSRNWMGAETVCLVSVWVERRYQMMIEQAVHIHSVWKEIFGKSAINVSLSKWLLLTGLNVENKLTT